MTTRLVLAGGRIIDPASGRDGPGSLVIEDGLIASPGRSAARAAAGRTFDCDGLLVVPGFIDLHVHLREPPDARGDLVGLAETIASGARAAVEGGFTTVCAMPNTEPPLDSPEAVSYYLKRGREAGLARVLPVGAMTCGRAGRKVADLHAMKAAGACAFSDDGSDVADPKVFEAVIAAAARLGAVAICHCEDPRFCAGGVINDGPMATVLGLPGIPAESEEIAVARACDAAARTGCRVHIAHVSTGGAAQAIRRAKAAGTPVTAEATPHHLALAEAAIRSRSAVFKVNPPLRSAGDVEAVINAVCDGTIDCLATDHAPHTAEAKARGLAEAPFGMIGLESALPVYVRALVEPGRLTWSQLIAKMTINPARVLGIRAGTLAAGAPADVTVIDPEAKWTIEPETFASRARNCPFAGWQVQGRAVLVLVGGRIVCDRISGRHVG